VIGQPAPSGTGELGAVSCADAEHCWAVGVAGPNPTTTATIGATGTAAATATVIVATDDGGATWSAQPITLSTTPQLSGISCPSAALCMAVGSNGAIPGVGIVLITRNGGATWTRASVPTGSFDLNGVECSTVADCTVIVNDGTNISAARTLNFGGSWTVEGNLPAGFENPRILSCSPATATVDVAPTCLVAGYSPTTTGHGQGAIVVSSDGGATWTAADVPAGMGVLQSVACDSPTECLAVGTTSTTISDVVPAKGEVLVSQDGGHTWVRSPTTPPVDAIYGVACPATHECAFVGTRWVGRPPLGTGAVAESENDSVSFTKLSTAYVPLTLTALSCPTDVHCVAVGGDTVARITLSPTQPIRSRHHTAPVR
jgi:photosystem II stability/assembly factor-like uncharacterized protein